MTRFDAHSEIDADIDANDNAILRWTVRSPARLHFGLIEICPVHPMLFGGLGVAIEEPAALIIGDSSSRVAITSQPWEIDNVGPWQARIQSVLDRSIPYFERKRGVLVSARVAATSKKSIRLEQQPEAHAGLGSGTQIACSVATLVAASYLSNIQDGSVLPASEVWKNVDMASDRSLPERVAEATGRGLRSHVGICGHLYGGFIVDSGVPVAPELDRQFERFAAPESWHVVLARLNRSQTVSGNEESDYFSKCAVPNPSRERMTRLIYDEIIPSIRAEDIARFGEAVHRFGRYGGEIFQVAQGEIFRDRDVAELVDTIRRQGVLATGQTSWGPTVYAITAGVESARELANFLQNRYGSKATIKTTRLANRGATVSLQARRT
ncbi:MAG: hypothetical protein SGI77_09770 [Pirellulaceae bacterium]|nr:hypothetical protein [Pirellulaceae bacterium]